MYWNAPASMTFSRNLFCGAVTLHKIRPYAATTIRRTKRVLRWFLQRKGWETMKVEEKRDKNGRVLRPGYTTIVVLEWRKNKKAYYNAIALSEQQKIFRAMAGTEDVA